MSAISLRLPDTLHQTVRKSAKKEHISINQFIMMAVAEKISALMTEEYIEARAKRGHRDKFEKAMAKVADVEPVEVDRFEQTALLKEATIAYQEKRQMEHGNEQALQGLKAARQENNDPDVRSLKSKIWDEINLIPEDKLAVLYDFIHYFRVGLGRD